MKATNNSSIETPKAPISLMRRVLFNLILLTLLIFVLFIIGEIAVRIFFKPVPKVHSCIVPIDDARYYVMKPNNTFQFEGSVEPLRYPVIWKTNAAGERVGDSLPNVALDSPKIGIATFGDSETFGWGVNIEETFQKRLEQNDSRLVVHNFGVPGYNVCQIAEHIQKTKYLQDPKLLIYFVHKNDFDVNLVFKTFPKSSELLRRLFVVYYLIKQEQAIKLRRTKPVIKTFADELVKMKEYCEQRNIEFVLAFQSRDDRFILEENQALKKYFFTNDSYNGRVIDCSIARSFPRIDDHFTKETHIILAELITKHLQENNFIRGSSGVPH